MTDQQLVSKLIYNDHRTIKEFFFVRCRPMLMYIGQYYCQTKYSAEELIGEFYEFLSKDDWHKLRIFKFTCSLNSYVTIIASRYFQHKRDKEMLPLEDNIQLLNNLQEGNSSERTFFMRDLYSILKELAPFDRFLVQRILIDGEKPGDILREAEQFMKHDASISTSAQDQKQFAGYVYTRYCRVRKALQKNMVALGYGK